MNPSGTFCWFDLSSTDLPTARRFYAELFGWDIREHGGQYFMIHDAEGRALGGMMAAHQGGSAWHPYVAVDDINAAVAMIGQQRGNIFLHHSAPEVGEFAIYSDRQGAVTAAIQLASTAETVPPRGEHHITWAELHTSDPEDAVTFHVAVFGWQTQVRDEASWLLLARDRQVGGIRRAQQGETPGWLIHVATTRIDALPARVEELGGKVLFPARTLGSLGRVAVFADPSGAAFAVQEVLPAP